MSINKLFPIVKVNAFKVVFDELELVALPQ